MFRGELTPDACYDLITHLPRESEFHAALGQDEEWAELRPAPGPPPPPTLAEFGPVVEAVARVHDLIALLIDVQVSRGGGKPLKIAPYPRPVTAAERVAKRGRGERYKKLVDRLLPRAQD